MKISRVPTAPGEQLDPDHPAELGSQVYHIPPGSETRTEAVSRWDLAWVIAWAVAGICVWGTLVGSMLPLMFRASAWTRHRLQPLRGHVC